MSDRPYEYWHQVVATISTFSEQVEIIVWLRSHAKGEYHIRYDAATGDGLYLKVKIMFELEGDAEAFAVHHIGIL